MSEKLYSCLLRVYPAAFRRSYGAEAMQLFRDRSRDERGPLAKLRLWVDLLFDLVIALPRTRSTTQPSLACVSLDHVHSVPAFEVLQQDIPRPGAIAYGGLLALLAFGSFFIWVGQVRMHRITLLANLRPESVKTLPSVFLSPRQFTFGPHQEFKSAAATQSALPVENATKAIIQAIAAHQIVMFGETHGNKQEYEWLCSLVKDPEFTAQVDDIVVELGNSLYQKSVDRYIAGEDVQLDQVQKAWRNMIGAVGPVSPVYGWLYQAVRDSNLQNHSGRKIRLLLGDPYGDWSKINNAEDLGPYLAHRDEWYAQVVKAEVLAHHRRALLIMGAGHFLRRNGPGLVEQAIRAAGVQPYLVVFGTNAIGAYDNLDHRFDAWPLPAIVSLSGNWVGELPANPVVTGGIVAPNSQRMQDVADAMLYVGPRDSLTQVFVPQSELVGTDYGTEVQRRLLIQTGRTMKLTGPAEGPQYQKPMQQTISNGIHRLPPNPPKSINDPLPPRPPSQ